LRNLRLSFCEVDQVKDRADVSYSNAHGENESSGGRLQKIMTPAMMLGFVGDTLTFLGGLILSMDALGREREFRKQKDWVATIKEFKGVELSRRGIRLLDENSVELVFIRLSVTRSIWGTVVVTLGFVALLASRILEALAGTAGHGAG
jgi:hypothetical protein